MNISTKHFLPKNQKQFVSWQYSRSNLSRWWLIRCVLYTLCMAQMLIFQRLKFCEFSWPIVVRRFGKWLNHTPGRRASTEKAFSFAASWIVWIYLIFSSQNVLRTQRTILRTADCFTIVHQHPASICRFSFELCGFKKSNGFSLEGVSLEDFC